MNRLNTLNLLMLLAAPWCAIAAAAERQPNVIVLLADDLGYGELGCQGNPQIPTPHIDSIAVNGIRLTDGYVTAPNCSPSRAGLLTGRIPTRFGYEFNPVGVQNLDPQTGLPPAERTLAELLHDVGYTTGLVGKWHLGGSAPYHPAGHGFDEFFGFLHEGHYYQPPPYPSVTSMLRRKSLPGNQRGRWIGQRLIYSTHMGHDEPDYDANNPIIRGGQPVVEQEYLTDAFTREATDFIARHYDKPFFLLVAYNAVHSPLQGADRYLQRFGDIDDLHRRIFAAMLANLDDSVGEILHAVREHRLQNDTLIFFLSDNGGPTRELTSSNRPLRGEKGQMYEGGVRVPFLVQWTGKLPAGTVYSKPVVSMDIFATMARLAGGDVPSNLDGTDLIPYLNGSQQGAPHGWLFWRQGDKAAFRLGDWKLVAPGRQGERFRWQLYQLADDIAETMDLAGERPEKLRELIRQWHGINRQMREPVFGSTR